MSDGNGSNDRRRSAFTPLTEFDSLRPGKKMPKKASKRRTPNGEVKAEEVTTEKVEAEKVTTEEQVDKPAEGDPWGEVAAKWGLAERGTDRALIWRVMGEVRGHRRHVVAIFAVSLLATPLALLNPVPLKIAVDSVLDTQPLPGFVEWVVPAWFTSNSSRLLLFAALLLVAVVVLNHLQFLLQYLIETYTGERITLGVRSRLLAHAQRLSFSYHDKKGTADSIYRITSDASAIQHLAIYGVIPFVTALLTLGAMIFIIFRLDATLALIALVISPVIFFYNHVYKIRMRSKYSHARRLESSALQVVQEVLTSHRVVKAFGREEHEEERFTSRSAEGMWARIKLSFAEGAFGVLVQATTAVGTAAVLYIGVTSVQNGRMSLGDLLLVMAYLTQLYGPLRAMSQQLIALQGQLASAERVFELFDEAPDVVEKPHAQGLRRASGSIEFRDVAFSYDDENPVLEGVSFSVPAGTRLGIIGRTGAGKTTLVSLLTRFYDPAAGAVRLDGIDLREYRLDDLRRQFAIVLQEPVLFSTSVADNIGYARPGASRYDIVAAAKAAGAHEFITDMPNGYDTVVDERGMRLSGGERQRVALARAFLKDAPILILDEPTSSVDTKTEQVIMDTMYQLMEGRTTFMIAHRLSTLEGCDALLEVESGRVSMIMHEADPGAAEMAAESR